MEKYFNVIIRNEEQSIKFGEFCKRRGILNVYDPDNKIFPHYRIICVKDQTVPTACWEISDTWKEGIFETGIQINGGNLLELDEIECAYDTVIKRRK